MLDCHFNSSDETSNHSPSSVDVLGILDSIKTFWEHSKVSVGKENSHDFIIFVTSDICRFAVIYFDIAIARAQKLSSLEKDPIELITEICLSINNINFIEQKLQSMIVAFILSIDKTNIKLPMVVRSTLKYGKDSKTTLVKYCATFIKPTMKAFVEKQTENKIKDSMPTDQLLAKMDEILHVHLTSVDYTIVRAALYETLIGIIHDIVLNSDGIKTSVEFCKNLELCYLVVEKMLKPAESKLTSATKEIQDFLQYSCLSTQNLIQQYFKDRFDIQQQRVVKSTDRVLSVECFFDNEKLIVKIWNAKNLFTVGSNSEANETYVKFHIVPENIFPEFQNMKTKVHSKTAFPLYEEDFEK